MIEKIIGNKNYGVKLELKNWELTIRGFGDEVEFPKEIVLFDDEVDELKKFLDENFK